MLNFTTSFDSKLNAAGIYYSFFGKEIVGSLHSYCAKFKNNIRNLSISDEDILNSRNRVLQELGINNLSILRQVHSSKVITVNRPQELNFEIEADAQVTKKNNIALGIRTADCTPILFVDVENRIIGAAHAGWRGAFSGIIENTVKELEAQGAKNIIAIIGPTISQDSYEVSQEFYDQFLVADKNNKQFFKIGKRDKHYYFNLPAYVTIKLRNSGVEQIYDVNVDTLSNDELLYSFRLATLNNEALRSENLSVIMIKE